MEYVNTEELEKLGLRVESDGVYVFNPEDVDSLDVTALELRLLELGILEAPYERIIKLQSKFLKNPVKIADSLFEYQPYKNDYIRVSVSSDAYEAYLDVSFPPSGEAITEKDILHRLLSAGVKYNIDREKIRQIVDNRIFVEKEIIARGVEPVIGEEAQIVIEVDTEISSEPLVKDDGSVDFRQIRMLKTVEKDQVLAVKIPATKGQDGRDVLGRIIDSTGKDAPLPRGENTYISDDGLSLYAAISGRIIRKKGRLLVENILAIQGDVDYSTGNINFKGDVLISGDVLTGFKVKTEGDIRIRGVVEGAEIISTKGSIIINRGIVGQNKARLLAAKDVSAEFINEATVEVGNNVTVGEYIMNSFVSADNEIYAIKGRGAIIGGRCYAEKAVTAKTIGSPHNVKTEIKIGGRIEAAMYEKMLIIERDGKVMEKVVQTVKKEIEFIELLKKKLPKFPKEKEKELKKCKLKHKNILEQAKEIQKKKEKLSREFRVLVSEEQKKISANTIYRNVYLSIDQNKMWTEYTYKICLVYSRDGDMRINFHSRYV